MSDLRRVLGYLSPYKKEAVLATIFLALVVVADLSIPRLVQVIIDEGVAKRDMNVVIWKGQITPESREIFPKLFDFVFFLNSKKHIYYFTKLFIF